MGVKKKKEQVWIHDSKFVYFVLKVETTLNPYFILFF
jgi:hypothetical protein